MKKFPALALAMTFILTACGAAPAPSRLTTAAEQDALRSVMEAASLSQIDVFFDWVNDYNTAAANHALPTEEPDTNCRLTAFLLLQDAIQAAPATDYGTYLMMDADELANNPRYACMRDKTGQFIALFNQVSVENARTEADYLAAFPAAWSRRGVIFPGGGVSLVSVVMNDSMDKALFIGHTGVLLEAEKTLWFIEKLAPDQPYQATQYAAREDLAAALLARPEYTLGDEDFHTFLLENDQVLHK
ncbi:MAG: DUF4300 family protein [Oscillibacter sp.]